MITPFANLASNASTAALDRRDGATVVYRACGVVDEGSRDSRHLAGRARGLRPARSEASCFRGAGEVGAVLPDRGKTGRWKPVVGPVDRWRPVDTGGGSGGGGNRWWVWWIGGGRWTDGGSGGWPMDSGGGCCGRGGWSPVGQPTESPAQAAVAAGSAGCARAALARSGALIVSVTGTASALVSCCQIPSSIGRSSDSTLARRSGQVPVGSSVSHST